MYLTEICIYDSDGGYKLTKNSRYLTLRCIDDSDGGYRLKKNSRYMYLTGVYMTVIVVGWITTADISRCVDDSGGS